MTATPAQRAEATAAEATIPEPADNLRRCPACKALIHKIYRPGGEADITIPVPPTPQQEAYTRRILQPYPSATWWQGQEGSPHRHQPREAA
jgi:hypothetical protein